MELEETAEKIKICKTCVRTKGVETPYSPCLIASDEYTYCPAIDQFLGTSLYVPMEN